ncbi:MAG TPA: hypothetical protein VLF90_02740 [Patescibacteria group bacterium]|nr:hypothetical protein [Patescibacteria group bacterium]
MLRLEERGSLLVPFVLVLLLFFGAAGFGIWAFSSRQDYKNNVTPKIAAAVAVAQQQTSSQKDNDFAQAQKQPLKNYNGPSTYGSLVVKYPKTWSAYVVSSDHSDTPVDGYFQPDFVPGIESTTDYALRVQISSTTYSQTMQQFSTYVKSGTTTVSAYRVDKVPSDLGSRIDGQLTSTKHGSMIVLPLRDKTLKVWTEADQYKTDFNNNILPNITFSP